MSRIKTRPENTLKSLQMETLEEKRLLTTTPIDVPNVPLDFSSYITDVDTIAEQELFVRQQLAINQDTRYLQTGESGLRLVEVKYGAAGIYNRFMQTWNGVDVHDSWVTVNQGVDGNVQQVFHQGHDNLQTRSTGTELTSIDRMMAERAALRNLDADATFANSSGRLVWNVGEKGEASLAWQLTVHPLAPLGDWLTLVDAETNKVISQENRMSFATGNGDVFDPNPWQTQGDGTGLADNNDATSPELEAQHVDVVLPGLDDGTGLLIGEFVDLATLNSPTLPDIDADEPTRQYYYDRDDERFEQVVVYYSVDGMNRYFHSLGFDDDTGAPNGIRDFPSLANAHWDNADNSFYSSGNDAIHFGDGGVDDAEDADIIAHEYGHAVQHNQNASWGGGEMGAMGEGFGDYLAVTYYFDSGDASYQSTDAACVGEWDATSYSTTDPPCLRRVDGNKMYPDDLTGGVHADGEIWSRALWDIRAALGGPVADQIILESHFGLPANSLMPDGAEAILLADQNLNGGANEAAIRQAFEDRGILEPLPTNGTVTLNQDTYNVSDTIEVTVVDANVPGSSLTVDIVVSNGDTETLTLLDQGNNVYFATINTVPGAPSNGDGQLQVALDDLVDVTYNDDDDGTGNPSSSTAQARISNVLKYNSDDVPVTLEAGPHTSIIEITDVGLITDLNVVINADHTFDADLDVFLIAPDGTRVELFTDVGGSGDNFTDTVLDDEAETAITDGTAPFTGSFRPEGSLADFDGLNITGTWTLEITDDFPFDADNGVLHAWSLCIETTDAAAGSVSFDKDVYNLEDIVEISVFDTNATDPLTVEVTSTSGDVETVILVDQGGGLFLNTINTVGAPPTTGDGTLQVEVGDIIEVTYIDLDDGTGSSQTVMDTATIANIKKYDSADVPVILEAGPHTSTINITDQGLVDDLNIVINAEHTFDADLDVFLIAPDGTRVELFTDVGGSGDNFINTVLDDEAGTSITAGSAPFTGSFIPEGSLADFDGISINGVWTLEITDDFPFDVDSGVLNAWSLCLEVVPDPSLQGVEVLGPPTIVEGDSGSINAVFEIMLDSHSTDFRAVDYQTVDGSALAGFDYTATSGTAFFSLGTLSVSVMVPVTGDLLTEDLENFSLMLSNPVNLNIDVSTATAEIEDNEVFSLGTLVDFGTQTSPVDASGIGMTDLLYDVTNGFGWEAGATNLQVVDRTIGSDIQRDVATFEEATFLADVSTQTSYDVTIEFGDNDEARETEVVIEGQNFGTVTTAAGEFVEHIFRVPVYDDQVTIDMTGGSSGGAITSLQVDAVNAWDLDFGTFENPVVAPGYFLADNSVYTPGVNTHGWANDDTKYLDYPSVSDPLHRDMGVIFDNVFFAEIADGTYQVTVYMGDYLESQDAISLVLQGNEVDQISSAPGELFVGNYNINVVDGLFEMRIKGNPGSPFGYVRAVEIAPTSNFAESIVGRDEGDLVNSASEAMRNNEWLLPSMDADQGELPRMSTIQQTALAGATTIEDIQQGSETTRVTSSANDDLDSASHRELDLIFGQESLDLAATRFGF